MNGYVVLANFLSVIHFAYICYVIFGQLAIMIGWPLGWRWIRNPWFRVSHIVLILIVAVEAMFDVTCPLTTWENNMWELAGRQKHNDSGFIATFIHDVMFFKPKWAWVLEWSYYGFALVVLATALLVPPRFRKPPAITEPEAEVK